MLCCSSSFSAPSPGHQRQTDHDERKEEDAQAMWLARNGNR